jgi:Ala-tRNA(Pro) deacylase
MSIPKEIMKFLDSQNVTYRHFTHPQAFTASETAEAQHVSGRELAKSVVVKADDRLMLAVIPANDRLDVEKLSHLVGASSIRLAREEEFEEAFEGCEVGAEPPLGRLYDLPVSLDVSFEDQPTIIFNAGSHTDTIQMSVGDFEKLEKPKIGRLVEGH